MLLAVIDYRVRRTVCVAILLWASLARTLAQQPVGKDLSPHAAICGPAGRHSYSVGRKLEFSDGYLYCWQPSGLSSCTSLATTIVSSTLCSKYNNSMSSLKEAGLFFVHVRSSSAGDFATFRGPPPRLPMFLLTQVVAGLTLVLTVNGSDFISGEALAGCLLTAVHDRSVEWLAMPRRSPPRPMSGFRCNCKQPCRLVFCPYQDRERFSSFNDGHLSGSASFTILPEVVPPLSVGCLPPSGPAIVGKTFTRSATRQVGQLLMTGRSIRGPCPQV